jgi:molybdate transport system substrate-binding protein
MNLDLLSAGAAKGLVEALQPAFFSTTGAGVSGTFGAVGAIRERLLIGEPCDVLVLTAAMLDDLARDGRIIGDSIAQLGSVATGIAVRSGEPFPAIGDRAALRATLAGARALYCPDPERATAGIHFVKVLRELDLYETASPRLRTYPSGAVAMREMAHADEPGLIGCTQVTEIRYTPGVELVGPLPAGFELATLYSVAVCVGTRQPELARSFAAALTGPESEDLRRQGGFETA